MYLHNKNYQSVKIGKIQFKANDARRTANGGFDHRSFSKGGRLFHPPS